MTIRHIAGIALGAAMLSPAWAAPTTPKPPAWLQIGYTSGHTGFNKTETTIKAKNVAKLANAGTFTTSAVPLQPLISDGVMFDHSNDQTLYAWNLTTGKLVWSIPLGTIDGPNGMAIGGKILVTNCGLSNGNGMCAYSTKTGKSLWAFGLQNGGAVTTPTIVGNTVYWVQTGIYGNYNNYNFVAVNLKTGVQLWDFGPCAAGYCGGMGPTAPAVDSGLVYFDCVGGGGDVITDTGVCALNASTGAFVWQYELGLTGHGDGQAGIIAKGGKVYAVYETAVCNQCGYTIDVTALNGATGAKLWDTPLTPQLVGSYFPIGAPALGPDGTVYQGISTSNNPNQPNLFALTPTGTVLWSASTLQQIPDAPTIVGKSKQGVLFFGCSSGGSSGSTCAFASSTGAFLWESTDGSESGNFAPVVTGGHVYNTCNFNNICTYALP
jgi:outer membrane protein assembly factor BamB